MCVYTLRISYVGPIDRAYRRDTRLARSRRRAARNVLRTVARAGVYIRCTRCVCQQGCTIRSRGTVSCRERTFFGTGRRAGKSWPSAVVDASVSPLSRVAAALLRGTPVRHGTRGNRSYRLDVAEALRESTLFADERFPCVRTPAAVYDDSSCRDGGRREPDACRGCTRGAGVHRNTIISRERAVTRVVGSHRCPCRFPEALSL